jgi:hypothetical protein
MTYSSGSLIQATDYNNIVGTATQSGTINYVWSTGNGQYGYGQTAVAQVTSGASTVAATQWSTAISTLNSIGLHQSNAGSGITAPTAGSVISVLNNLTTFVTTVNTNHLLYNAQGSTTTGTVYTAAVTATQGTTYGPSTYATRTVTFASADAARYFFNAGGQINLVITGVTNNDGTSRSADAVSVIGTYFQGMSGFKAITNGQKTGTGGTLAGGGYVSGYYSLTTSAQTIAQVTSTSSTYSTDYCTLAVASNGTVGSNADKGSVLTFTLGYYSAHPGSFNDTLNVTVSHRVDIVYPESTNLTNTWGTVTVA